MVKMFDTRSERNRFYNSKQWRHLRLKILKRDHYECLFCKERGLITDPDTTLVVDHIKELADYPEYALDPDNLRTLCFHCHEVRHDRVFKGNFKPNKWADDEWY